MIGDSKNRVRLQCLHQLSLLSHHRTLQKILPFIFRDCAMYWKVFKAEVIAKEKTVFTAGLDKFVVDGNYTALLSMDGNDSYTAICCDA